MAANIVWHNAATNETQLWIMDAQRVASRATILGQDGAPAFIGPPWSIVAAGDFNRDGQGDLLWHNSATSGIEIWFLSGGKVDGTPTVLGEDGQPTFVGWPWSIVGAGDFNNDGWADILWHNSDTNGIEIWFMGGARVASRGTVLGEDGSPVFVGPPWSIVGTGNFSNDGKADILWHNSSTNETQLWFMDGARVTGRATVIGEDGRAAFVGPPWTIVGAADFNGDGKSDILWHNSATNETQIWFMNGYTVAGRGTVLGETGVPAFVGPPWAIVGANQFVPGRSLLPPGSDPCFENAKNQKYWRFCAKCNGLAFDGYSDKGSCAAGGGHQAVGYMFVLPHDVPETVNGQASWRFCIKCTLMFFDGYPEKGVCAAGGGHQAAGFRFVLPHDLPATALDQDAWRFCTKCDALFFDGYDNKGRCPQGGGHAAAGFNFVLPHDIHEPFVFSAPIVTGGLAALGGSVTVTVNLDGSVRWQGHMHDSGLDNYDFAISAVVATPTGQRVALVHSGHVSGSVTPGSSDEDWDETRPPPAAPDRVSGLVGQFTRATFDTNLNYDSGILSTFETFIDWSLKTTVGSAVGPLGAIVFMGLEIGSLIDSGSLVPGARLASGILWMAGPDNTLYAIAAEGIVSAGAETRDITQEQYDWANEKVFLGALPPRDSLVLTDTIGQGGRPFTFPRADGKITLNMGPTALNDPRNFLGETPAGKTFIHELVHACQIQNAALQVSFLAGALSTTLCKVLGDDPYLYGPAPLDYTGLNIEQQAQIVGDWFAGGPSKKNNKVVNHTGIPMDEKSPYFEYIRDNVRIGNY